MNIQADTAQAQDIPEQDSALMERIARKEIAAMEVLYRRYENTVYRFALKKLKNEFEAEEIVNTVMLEVWNTAGAFNGRSKVSTWLYSITHHRIIDLIRKRKPNDISIDEIEPVVDTRNDADMLKVVAAGQTRWLIDFCLEKLSGDHKQVLQLLFFMEQTYEEIATIMACSIGTVKSRVFHAKKLLKQCLQKSADFNSVQLNEET